MLDTWFSSALWPFATLGWPDDTPELRAFYPTSFLSTARDIIFLWVARMIMMGIEFVGDVPFGDVYIHSVIQAPRRAPHDEESLGTGIDPLERDRRARRRRAALRPAGDVLDPGRALLRRQVEQGRDLANKLWNASRLVLLNAARRPSEDPAPAARQRGSRTAGSSRGCERTIASVTEKLDALRLRPRGPRATAFF